MATTFSAPWTDSDLRRCSFASRGTPYAPASPSRIQSEPSGPTGARRASGKRKRSTSYAVTDHPLQASPIATAYVTYQGLAAQQPIQTQPGVYHSPPPLVCEEYRTAPGQETPNMTASVMTLHIQDTPELIGYRSNWTPHMCEKEAVRATPLMREANGKSRVKAEPYPSGWSAFGVVGGMAGRIFSFCYNMLPATSSSRRRESQDFDSWRRAATPLPGMYPEEDDLVDSMVDVTPIRPAKRIQTDSAKSWVLVDHDKASLEPVRLSPRKISNSALGSTTASRASPRQSVYPRHRKSTSMSFSQSPSFSPSPSPQVHVTASTHKRRASTASTRSIAGTRTLRPRRSQPYLSPRMSTTDLGGAERDRTSLTPEAQRYVVARERRERDAEKSMRKMSRQVQELIRQGQQALGSPCSDLEPNFDYLDEIEVNEAL